MKISTKDIACGISIAVYEWLEDRNGATAVEYALLAGGIGAACISAMFLMGNNIEGVLNGLGDSMTTIQNNVE